MIDISFVILTCNSQEVIEPCIKSYAGSIENRGLKAEFIIVDNGSKDKTVAILNDQVVPSLPQGCKLTLISLPKNLGTTRSRNLALKQIAGSVCVVCDSDTEFLKGDWQQAIRFLNEHKDVGIVAAHLFYQDGVTQQSVKRFPTLADKLLKLRKTFLRMRENVTDYYLNFDWSKIHPVDTAISAFWMFRKELLQEIGLLDEHIFYAPEDVDFCLRAWKAGKQVLYYPGLEIRHKTQRISHNRPFSRIAVSHLLNLLYYFHKHRYWFSRDKVYAQISAHAA